MGDLEDLYLYKRLPELAQRTRTQSAEDEIFDLFTDDEVKRALEELPESFLLPILLADVQDFSYQEIATMLDIPIGTVMSRLHRGRRLLREMLGDYASEQGIGTTTKGEAS